MYTHFYVFVIHCHQALIKAKTLKNSPWNQGWGLENVKKKQKTKVKKEATLVNSGGENRKTMKRRRPLGQLGVFLLPNLQDNGGAEDAGLGVSHQGVLTARLVFIHADAAFATAVLWGVRRDGREQRVPPSDGG